MYLASFEHSPLTLGVSPAGVSISFLMRACVQFPASRSRWRWFIKSTRHSLVLNRGAFVPCSVEGASLQNHGAAAAGRRYKFPDILAQWVHAAGLLSR